MVSCVNSNNQISKESIRIANLFNNVCPYMIDEDLRLDIVLPVPNNTLQFNYTLVNHTNELIDTVSFKSLMESQYLINLMKGYPKMEQKYKKEWTLYYFFNDKNGEYVCSIVITPDRYK
jgi:hypothetical protein